MTTFERLQDIISSTLNIDKSVVTESLTMEDIPEWDSMGNIAIITALEESFGIEIPIDDLFELNSVASIMKEMDKLITH